MIVDFGRELYVPWRITEGDRLYNDIAYFNGPLSPYVNALWFRLFGPGVSVLLAVNGIILAGISIASFRILSQATSRMPAAIACCTFLSLCAFAQYSTYGSFNFMAPYSHELTHGLLIAALGMALLPSVALGNAAAALGVGLAAGMEVLTKPEIAVAADVALFVGFGAAIWGRNGEGAKRGLRIVMWILGLSLPILSVLLAGATIGGGQISTWLWTPWRAAADTDVWSLSFYKAGMGLDDPLGNIFWILIWMGIWLLLIGGPVWTVKRLPTWISERPSLGAWTFAVVLPFAAVATIMLDGFRGFGPLLPLMLILLFAQLLRPPARDDQRAWGIWVVSISGLLFSLLLLSKLGLRPRLRWYGFALSAPALLAAVAWAFGPLPRRLDTGHGERRAVIGAVSALLLALGLLHMTASQLQYARRTFPIGQGVDRFLTDPERGAPVAEAMAVIHESQPDAQTLLVVPEGASINFLLRKKVSVPFYNFMPPELILFGEDRIVAALAASPPELVILAPKPGDDYEGSFGNGFGEALENWVRSGYVEEQRFVGGEFFGERFRLELMIPR